jgi:hypothetical protein
LVIILRFWLFIWFLVDFFLFDKGK